MHALLRDPDLDAPPPPAWPSDLQFAPRDPDAKPPARERIAALVFVVVAHAWLAWWLDGQSRVHAVPSHDAAMVVQFIRTMAPTVIHPPRPESATPSRRAATTQTAPRRAQAPPPTASTAPRADAPTTALSLYATDGRLQLPDGLLREIDRTSGDARQFDFQLPDLEAAGTFLDRPPALTYEATRFDRYWKPNDDLLHAVLRKAMEATTKEVRIKIPGDSRHSIVCTVSLLAAGGSCGIQLNGKEIDFGDDPDTLTADEAAACSAWWDKIVAARTQDEWRQTRRLYEAQCRKPLLVEPPKPIERPAQ
jgi:hypothetical protein